MSLFEKKCIHIVVTVVDEFVLSLVCQCFSRPSTPSASKCRWRCRTSSRMQSCLRWLSSYWQELSSCVEVKHILYTVLQAIACWFGSCFNSYIKTLVILTAADLIHVLVETGRCSAVIFSVASVCLSVVFGLLSFEQNRTALCWILWHSIHSPHHIYVSSSHRSNRFGLSHWDPYAVCIEAVA